MDNIKTKIYNNRLKILEEALKLKEDSIIDFILYNYDIKIEDILSIVIENGLVHRFPEFVKMYTDKLNEIILPFPKEINRIIKSYLGINYKYINKTIINEYNIFTLFMKTLYTGKDIRYLKVYKS